MYTLLRYLFAASLALLAFDCASALPLSTRSASEEATNVVQIQQVLNLFAIAVDQHRWDLLSQVFTPDIMANFNVPGSPVLRGLDAVIQLLKRLEDVPSFHGQSTHWVDLSVPQRPHSVTYNTGVFFQPGPQGQVYTSYGR